MYWGGPENFHHLVSVSRMNACTRHFYSASLRAPLVEGRQSRLGTVLAFWKACSLRLFRQKDCRLRLSGRLLGDEFKAQNCTDCTDHTYLLHVMVIHTKCRSSDSPYSSSLAHNISLALSAGNLPRTRMSPIATVSPPGR